MLQTIITLVLIYQSFNFVEPSKPRIFEQDPNSLYICKGKLGESAACQCKTDEHLIQCINAQFVQTTLFLEVNHYTDIKKVTFHGNNFQTLPNASIFGDVVHHKMTHLNISANYIMELNSGSLKGLPNLRVLDLSNNEIVLKEKDIDFLTFLPRLEELYLRKAFIFRSNHTKQFDLMMKMFRKANLVNLKYIDLSYNFFSSLPYDLSCPFPSLQYINLGQNLLETIKMNSSCLSNIQTLDLSRNSFNSLDKNLTKFADNLPAQSLIIRSNFYCDCKSIEYIKWIRATDVIREKNILKCFRSSPAEYSGSRIMEVPLDKLDCTLSLYNINAGHRHFSSMYSFSLAILPALFIYLYL
uniref:LRRCT domain-containing protein n=1 Tax=Rhabditophanes sp. KR3021 TaxID=114890 RepID=A0AC35UHJ0_9BILA